MSNHGWTTGWPWTVENLRDEQVSEPVLRPGWVVVELAAMALNPVDYRLAKSLPRGLWARKLLGSDFSGRVVKLGNGVNHVAVGDSIYGMLSALRGGVSASRIAVPAQCLQKAPAQLDLVDAAAIPLAGLTSLQSLRDHGDLQADQTIFINGASGGVGTFGVQIGKAMGASVVASCSEANRSLVSELGASHVVDYREEDFTKGERAFDGVYDARGNRSLKDCAKVVRKGGWVVTTEPTVPHLLQQGFNGLRSVKVHAVLVRSTPEDLSQLATWVDEGQIRPVIDRVYPRQELRAAYTHLRSRRARGKLVIRW